MAYTTHSDSAVDKQRKLGVISLSCGHRLQKSLSSLWLPARKEHQLPLFPILKIAVQHNTPAVGV